MEIGKVDWSARKLPDEATRMRDECCYVLRERGVSKAVIAKVLGITPYMVERAVGRVKAGRYGNLS